MRRFKLAGILCVLALALAAFATAGSASASPTMLVLEGKSGFSFTSGAGELADPSTGLAIKCKTDKGSGSITSATELSTSVTFEKCNIGGLAAQSLGGKSGKITLAELKGHLCWINEATLDAGVLLTLPAEGVHIEVPALGQLLVVTGSVVGLIVHLNEPGTSGTLNFEEGLKCEGAVAPEDELMIELEHSGSKLAGIEVSQESITYAGSVELMS